MKQEEQRKAFRNTPEYRGMKNAQKRRLGIMKKRKSCYKSAETRLISNLKRRIDAGLSGEKKAAAIIVLLGLAQKNDPMKFLWNYLKTKFKKGMTIKNYGKWHVDHIKPCALFNLTDTKQQMQCFRYTNLQPLWAEENLKKSKKYNV